MKIFLAVLAITGLIGGYTFHAVAEDGHNHDHDHHEYVEHYEGTDFKSADEAKKALKENNEKIAKILKSKDLTNAQLEKIHKISYTLEDAIDKLISKKAGVKRQLESVDEAIQAVHYASEKHEEAKVREWFSKLEAAVKNLDAEPKGAEPNKEESVYQITIKDHKFTPDEIRAPAGQKLKLIVDNQDPTPEEFESDDFRREKIIAGNSKATIFVGPLKPGKYHFFGEFNLSSANGYLIVE